ncbi:hypothetical protein V6Z11_A12G164300 [Gossypium hirsutum]
MEFQEMLSLQAMLSKTRQGLTMSLHFAYISVRALSTMRLHWFLISIEFNFFINSLLQRVSILLGAQLKLHLFFSLLIKERKINKPAATPSTILTSCIYHHAVPEVSLPEDKKINWEH